MDNNGKSKPVRICAYDVLQAYCNVFCFEEC